MSALRAIGATNEGASGDVVFIHGLDGNAIQTWGFDRQESWGGWLQHDRPDLNLWSLDYEVRSSTWRGRAMPLSDRAVNALAAIQAAGVGRRPLCFITHSMGGLLAKAILRHAFELGDEYRQIGAAVRGAVFFATPHAGSDAATLVGYLRFLVHPTVAISELEAHGPALRELNLWYRNNAERLGVATKVFYETWPTNGVIVVNATSADPGIPRVTPIPIDADHRDTCKPLSPDDLRYRLTLQFIEERLSPPRRDLSQLPEYFAAQRAVVSEHASRFVGRKDLTRQLDAFVAGHDRGYFIVVGGAGQGKTAFASHLVQTREYPHHFINRTGGRSDPYLILRSLVAQLAALARVNPGNQTSLAEAAKSFEDLLPVAADRQRPLAVVIDALNQYEGPDDDDPPFIVTDGLPSGVYFIVSSSPGRELDRLKSRLVGVPHEIESLRPLGADEVRAFLAPYGVVLSDAQLNALVEATGGNALLLQAATRELVAGKRFDGAKVAAGIVAYFQRATARLDEQPAAKDTLGLLATARTWMSVSSLAAASGRPEREIAENGIASIRDLLESTGDRFGLYHDQLYQFVTNSLLYADEIRDYHRRLATWLINTRRGDADYRWSSLAYHLFHAGDEQGLRTHITTRFLTEKAQRFGYVVLEDLELLARVYLDSADSNGLRSCFEIADALSAHVDVRLLQSATRSLRFNARASLRIGKPWEPVPRAVAGLDVYVGIVPKASATADFVEIVDVDGKVSVCVGDAPASGLRSAFLARFMASLFAKCAREGQLDHVADVFERVCSATEAEGLFENVAMLGATVNLEDDTCALVNAGLPPPVVYSGAEGVCRRIPLPGVPLNSATDRDRRFESRHVELERGDTIVFVTDGIPETSRFDNPYGYRFTTLLENMPEASARSIGQAILDDWGKHPRPGTVLDDATLVVVRRG